MPPSPIPLDRISPIDVPLSGKVVLSGKCYVSHDGSTLDAATTEWPKDAPGGASRDPNGLIDPTAGGLALTNRDLEHNTYEYVREAESTEVCRAAGFQGACLVPRTVALAQQRNLMTAELLAKVKAANGCLTVEVPEPPPLAAVAPAFPYLGVLLGLGAATAIGLVWWRTRKKRAASPTGQLLALARRVGDKIKSADAIVAAPLSRALKTALDAVQSGRVDASSAEGKRVAAILLRVEGVLDSTEAEAKAAAEREAADELVREVESALEAAEEARRV